MGRTPHGGTPRLSISCSLLEVFEHASRPEELGLLSATRDGYAGAGGRGVPKPGKLPKGPRPRRRAAISTLAFALAALTTGVTAADADPLPPLHHLAPGKPLDVHQDVPVTVVFVGFEAGVGAAKIDPGRLLAPQLRSERPVDRTTRYYEQIGYLAGKLEPSALGLTYDYRYRSVFSTPAFDDALFSYLASIARGPLPPTVFQQAYSANPLAAQVVGSNWAIDATLAEQWLAANAGPMLGVDTTRPTVFFVNWFGRSDFRFHTYGFLGTRPGKTFPVGRTQGGQMVAFGGSTPDAPYGAVDRLSRVWFYDLSAGPDYGTASWILDVADFDGDGVPEERIPPIWEYGTSHWYRPFDDLTADLAKVLRFVAVDLFFGQSPIYDPAISEPLLSDHVELDTNVFAGVPGRDPLSTLRVGEIPASLGRLDPTRTYSTDVSVAPLAGPVASAFDCQQTAFTADPQSCFGDRTHLGPAGAFYDLDVYFGDHANQYLDGVRYEVPVAAFDVPDRRLAPDTLAGFSSSAPPNIQSWSYVWLSDFFRQSGFEDTGLVTHEIGHHLGLSHVHDGFDVGLDTELSPTGPTFFMFVGDESQTGMSYIPNTNEFGQFDRDNMARWQLAARLDNANRILGDVVASPRASAATDEIATADAKAGQALDALAAWDLLGASRAASDAYAAILAAATLANVHVEPWSGVSDERGAGILAGATDPRDAGRPRPPGAAAESLFAP